jgi:hypothetical protein
MMDGGQSTELSASPADLIGFVQKLQQRPPANLAGLVWFRLPAPEDRRAWDMATWLQVMQGKSAVGKMDLQVEVTETPSLYNIFVSNAGAIDGSPPETLTIDAGCSSADGANGYQAEHQGDQIVLRNVHPALLHTNAQRLIGWVRCLSGKPVLHAEP